MRNRNRVAFLKAIVEAREASKAALLARANAKRAAAVARDAEMAHKLALDKARDCWAKVRELEQTL